MKTKCFVLLASLILILAVSVNCIAAGDALVLQNSTVVDGDVNVPKELTIELTFSGNICDISVADYNKECFFLFDSGDKTVPISLAFPDTQMQNAFKKQAFITPKEALKPGEKYRLVVDKNLSDKNGLKLGADYIINFTVSEDDSVTTTKNEDLSKLLEFTTVYDIEGNREITTDEVISPTEPEETDTSDSKKSSIPVVIPVVVIIVAIAAFTVLAGRKK